MVYVVTAVHNRIAITTRFVESLKKQTYHGSIHFLMVDDGSTDGTDEKIKELYPNTSVLYGDGNLFWGGALQKAYEYLLEQNLSEEDIIFYVNDDSRLDENFLENAIELLNKHPNDLVTGCAYGIKTGYYLDGPVEFNLNNGKVTHLPAGAIGNCASTRALLLKVPVFKDIGGFHPVLLPHYGSDYEYTIRAAKKGHRIISDEKVRYTFSEDTTGDNSHKNISLRKLMRKTSKLNPFYKMTFIIMIAPIHRIPNYVIYQIKHFMHHKRDEGTAV